MKLQVFDVPEVIVPSVTDTSQDTSSGVVLSSLNSVLSGISSAAL